MININDLTLGQIKEIGQITGTQPKSDDSHWEISKPYFIRTATYHLTGRLVKVTPIELVLEDAAWIADSGRFTQAVSSGDFSEVEPFPTGMQVIVNRTAVIDAVKIPKFPTSQK
jgi:hypothetical protein